MVLHETYQLVIAPKGDYCAGAAQNSMLVRCPSVRRPSVTHHFQRAAHFQELIHFLDHFESALVLVRFWIILN